MEVQAVREGPVPDGDGAALNTRAQLRQGWEEEMGWASLGSIHGICTQGPQGLPPTSPSGWQRMLRGRNQVEVGQERQREGNATRGSARIRLSHITAK